MQIILNAFRLKPLDEVLPAAREAGVGIIARVPLASGLLSGRYTHDTTFAANDHRNYNRHGESFDVGETFSGVDYDDGRRGRARSSRRSPRDAGPDAARQAALAWIAQQPGVTHGHPGCPQRRAGRANARPASRRACSARSSTPPCASSTTAASAPRSTPAGSQRVAQASSARGLPARYRSRSNPGSSADCTM